MPADRLAKVAYAAYASEINHPLDEWQDLKVEEQHGWQAAADAVIMALGTKPLAAEEEPLAD